MTIYELLEFFTEPEMQEINIYSLDKDNYIFKGRYEDMPDSYADLRVSSIDNLDDDNTTFTINIINNY